MENLCLKLLLQQQPVARDLREISSALKMISDLERIGDQAADIAELTRFVRLPDGPGRQRIEEMSKAVIRMVTDSVDSFVKRDLDLAREVCREDDQVDDLFNQVKKELIGLIAADADSGELWLDLIMVAKYLERIGDHATNVAEWVEYSITGESPLQQLSGLRTGAMRRYGKRSGGAVLTYEDVKNNSAIRTYIQRADESLTALGYTEHSFAHVTAVAENAAYILSTLGYPERTVELAKIAGFLHDIGNLVNRVDHSQSGAVMAFRILDNMDCPPEEIATIVTAIGNHDEGTGMPVNAVAAALILADKSDVRRSRVRNPDMASFDIHDRVNYSVKKSVLKINEEHTLIKLKLSVDTKYGSVMDYFEIFMGRMLLCRKAAEKLGLQFKLMINEQQLI